jgi:hypothetical protein
VLPALALAALLSAAPLLVGCGTGAGGVDDGGVTAQPFYVASFTPGEGSPEEQKYALSSESRPTSSPAGTSTAPMADVTPGSDTTGLPSPAIAWVNGGQYVAVIAYGSGSCPDGPHSIRVVGDQKVEVRLGQVFPESDACTADLRAYVTVVKLPQGVTPAKPLTASFENSEATLPAASH